MILADEYQELGKELEVFALENKFSMTKSASPTQVTCRRCEETDNQDGHHHTKPDDSRQQTHPAEANGHHLHSNRDSQTIPCGGRQATHRGHKMPPISQNRRRPVGNAVGTDTGLEDVETSGCYFAKYAARWVSKVSIAANDREMASDLSRREASGDRTMPPLQTDGKANRGGAAVLRSCDD